MSDASCPAFNRASAIRTESDGRHGSMARRLVVLG